MRNCKLRWVSVFAAIVVTCGIAYAINDKQDKAISTQQSKRKKDADNLPIVDFESAPLDKVESPSDSVSLSIRRIRSAKYDSFPFDIKENPIASDIVMHTHTVEEFSPIPTLESDLIVIGDIVEAKAYLSNNKSFVYSEYEVRIKEIPKRNSQLLNDLAETVTVARIGGAIRFPSGHVQSYRESEYGVPLNGHSYVFFLRYTGIVHAFTILTAYELSEGRALALDNAGRFAKYKNIPEQTVLEAVRKIGKGE